jgi:phage gpG-like protein
MAIKGDTKALQQLRQRLGKVRSAEFRKRISNVVGHEALSLVLEGFAASKDPYGVRWAPLKVRQGQPLLDKGLLRNSINVRAVALGFELATDNVGAKLHQHGGTVRPKNARALSFMVGNRRVFAKSVTIPARPFFPDARGLPRRWAAAFRAIASDFISSTMGHAHSHVLGGA